MLVLSGGTGTPKLLRGLVQVMNPEDITVVVNTADDLWVSGNLVCPDLDTVLYTLAGLVDRERWWGITGDSFRTHEFLKILGMPETLALGDKDRAVHIRRSQVLREGGTLSMATRELSRSLGVKTVVAPMSDDPVATMIQTPEGEMHLQEFWVARRGIPEVSSLRWEGMDRATPSPVFTQALEEEDTVLVGPSNPVTSIGPILALPGVRSALKGKRVIAVSPLKGDRPYSGPAAKFMRAVGIDSTDRGVMKLLGPLTTFIVSKQSSYPGPCVRLDTLIRDGQDSLRLAREIVKLAQS